MKKTKLLCLLLTLVLALTVSMQGIIFTAYAENNATSLLLGDANLDFKVNVKDATSIQKTAAKFITLGEIASSTADIDENKIINVKDATNIQKWVANMEVPYLIGQLFEYIGEILSQGGFILLNINPEIRIGFNADGNVTTVTADNKDGKALIEGFKGFEGKSCKEVVDELLSLVKDAGYLVDDIDGENKVVVIQLEAGSKAPKVGFMEELESGAKKNTKDLDVKPEFIKIEDKDYDSKYATEVNPSEFITLEKAVEIALAYSGVWAEDAVFEEKEYDIDDGTPYYELEFTASGFEFECEVNALNGKVVEFSKEKADRKPSDSNPVTPVETKPSQPANEYITLEDAKEIALKDAGVNAEDAKFDDRDLDLDDGTPYYEIEFTADGFEYEYEIHAVSGKIIESEREPVDDDDYFDDDHKKPISTKPAESKPVENKPAESKPAENKPAETKPVATKPATKPATDNTQVIGAEVAKSIALEHAGVNADTAKFEKAELDKDDGKLNYEIEFEAEGFEYEYEIDALSGKILNFEKDRADD